MKRYPPRAKARHPRVPAFSPVPGRARADGWSPDRQAAFLAELALTGSVSDAARRVGMARESVYRLRRRAGSESFSAAWDAVLRRQVPSKRKVTADERARRASEGLLKPMIYRSKHVGNARKTDKRALLGHLAQIDRGLVSWSRRSQDIDSA